MVELGLRGDRYHPLQDKDLEAIDQAIRNILCETGFEVHSAEARKIYAKAGAEVDEQQSLVKLNNNLIDKALKLAPENITLYARDEDYNLSLGENKVHFGTGGTVLNILDLETGEKRKVTMEDLADITRLVDYLDNIHFYVIPVYPEGCTNDNIDINRFYTALKNTCKHIMGGIYSSQGIREVIDAAAIIAGGIKNLQERPFISFITCVMSPLKLDRDYTDFLIQIAEKGLPLAMPAEPLAGGTGPVTIAGNITLMAAESLASVVLAQLVNPGTPVMLASTASAMDLKQAAYITGEIEMGLMHAGLAQLAQYYKLPLYATAGMSDSKLPDIQSGYERALTSLLTGLAGANFIHDAAGLLEFCTTVSYEQYVIDDEIIGMVMRAVKGIEVNRETIAQEVIEQVGPGGHFLDQDHTRKYMRSEYYQPNISDRQRRGKWEKEGGLDARDRAREKVRKILQDHKPAYLESGIEKQILNKYGEKLL